MHFCLEQNNKSNHVEEQRFVIQKIFPRVCMRECAYSCGGKMKKRNDEYICRSDSDDSCCGGPESFERSLYERLVCKAGKIFCDDKYDDNRRHYLTDRRNYPAKNSVQLRADIRCHIDADRAGCRLGNSNHVVEHFGRNEMILVDNHFLHNRNANKTAANRY